MTMEQIYVRKIGRAASKKPAARQKANPYQFFNMKKIFASTLALFLLALPMAVQAVDYKTWSGLESAFDMAWLWGFPFTQIGDIQAPAGAGPLSTTTLTPLCTSFSIDGSTLTGGGGDNAVIWNNEACSLAIWGDNGSTISSRGSTSSTLVNWGTCTLNNVSLDNGVTQTYTGASLVIGGNSPQPQSGATLSGANNITAGKLGIGGAGGTLTINGGSIGANAVLSIAGPHNTFAIQAGNVILNNGDLLGDGVITRLSGTGILTFDTFSYSTSTTNGGYYQTGGTLILAGSSALTLDPSGSISGGIVTISTGNTLEITGGAATLNGTGTVANNWVGTVYLTAGALTLSGVTNQGTFMQTGGNLYLTNGSILTVTDSTKLVGGAMDISGGAKLQLNYTGTGQVSSLTFNGGSTQANGTYGSTTSAAANKNDTYFTGTGTIMVSSVITTGFDSWARDPAQGLTAGLNDGPSDDPNHNGICNLLEFVLGGAPSGGTHTGLPTLTKPTGTWEFAYERSVLSRPPATIQIVEYSSDLTRWTPVVIRETSGGRVTITPGSSSDHVIVTLPDLGTTGFVRLKVIY
jgi:hypothetical protein